MTNPSHTELAAQARDWAVHLEQANVGRTDQYIAHTLRRCAAALESPERVQGELVTVRLPTLTPEQAADVSWGLSEALVDAGRIDDGRMLLFVGEASTPPTAPAQDAELQRLQQKVDALAREAWSWSKACEAESTKLYAVKKAISDAYGLVSRDQPWTPEHSKNYPKQASEIINAALTIFSATPSPQAEKQPLSLDEIRAWAVRRTSALGPEGITDPIAFLEDGVRWGEAQHGIVTKESSK